MVVVLVVGILTAASASASKNPSAPSFVAYLSAAPGVSTAATGEATFQLSPDGQSLNYTLTVSNIKNVFMAHIHLSPSLDILTWLYPTPSAMTSETGAACSAAMSGGPISSCPALLSGTFSGVLAQGTISSADLKGTACPMCSGLPTPTMPAFVAALESGQTLVIVHTEQNTAGEIRGAITSVVSAATMTATPNASVTASGTTFGISTTDLAVVGLALVVLISAGSAAKLRGSRSQAS